MLSDLKYLTPEQKKSVGLALINDLDVLDDIIPKDFDMKVKYTKMAAEKGLPTHYFSRIDDGKQAKQVYLGLMKDLDVSDYACGLISGDAMEQIRKAMMDGINLTGDWEFRSTSDLREERPNLTCRAIMLDKKYAKKKVSLLTLRELAGRKHTLPPVLPELAKFKKKFVLRELASRRDISKEFLEKIFNSLDLTYYTSSIGFPKYEEVVEKIARNPKTPSSVIKKLCRHRDWLIRFAIIHSPNIDAEDIRKLSTDCHDIVANKAKEHPLYKTLDATESCK